MGYKINIARYFTGLVGVLVATSCYGQPTPEVEASAAQVREAVFDCITSGALSNAGPSALDQGVPKKELAPVILYLCRGSVADKLINAIHGKLPIEDNRDHPEWRSTVYYLGTAHNQYSSKCVRNERPGANPAFRDESTWCEIYLDIDPAAFERLGH